MARIYKYQEVVDDLEGAISRGEYRDRLPSVRLLGEMFKVNNRTVLHALQELTGRGLILQNGNQSFLINRSDCRRPVTNNIVNYIQASPGESGGDFVPGRLEELAAAAGKRLIRMKSMSPEMCSIRSFWESLSADGVIFLHSSLSRDAAYQLKLSGIPFVAANRMPREWGVNCVDFDHEGALRTLFSALVQARHRRIAMIQGGYALRYFREIFFSVYYKFMNDYAIFDPELFCYPEGDEGMDDFMVSSIRKLLALPLPPSAIYLGSELNTDNLSQLLRSAGIEIPGKTKIYCSCRITGEGRVEPAMPGLWFDYRDLMTQLWELLKEVITQPAAPPQERLVRVKVAMNFPQEHL